MKKDIRKLKEKNLNTQNVLEKLKNKTIVVVAHRLETIKEVDEIFVVNDGKIVENGTYLELMNQPSYFKKLYKAIK